MASFNEGGSYEYTFYPNEEDHMLIINPRPFIEYGPMMIITLPLQARGKSPLTLSGTTLEPGVAYFTPVKRTNRTCVRRCLVKPR